MRIGFVCGYVALMSCLGHIMFRLPMLVLVALQLDGFVREISFGTCLPFLFPCVSIILSRSNYAGRCFLSFDYHRDEVGATYRYELSSALFSTDVFSMIPSCARTEDVAFMGFSVDGSN